MLTTDLLFRYDFMAESTGLTQLTLIKKMMVNKTSVNLYLEYVIRVPENQH